MAGAGYKLFNTGDVLTAAQVNTYLMEQTVMVFANAAARTTALSGVVSEGMISYLKDTNAVEVYDGSNWVSSDDPNAIQNTIVDAKGDLISASAADVPARLAVGNNGETLVADSSTSTGLRWQTSVNGNGIINGGFDCWQRSTNVTVASSGTVSYVAADRWGFSHSGSSASTTISRQTATNNGSQYALRLQRVNGQTNAPYYFLSNVFESSDTARFAGKTVTLSVYVKVGANYSGTTTYMQVRTGTGNDQSAQGMIDGTWTGYASNAFNFTPTTTSTRYSYTFTLGSTVTQLGINLGYLSSGTAGANDWIEFEQVQLEVGSVATNFKRAGGTLAGELAACQRYYYVVASGLDKFVSWSAYYSSTGVAGSVPFKVSMRTTPSLVATTITDGYKISANSDFFTTLNLSSVSNSESGYIFADTNVSGTTGYASFIQTANSGTSVAFNAEL